MFCLYSCTDISAKLGQHFISTELQLTATSALFVSPQGATGVSITSACYKSAVHLFMNVLFI